MRAIELVATVLAGILATLLRGAFAGLASSAAALGPLALLLPWAAARLVLSGAWRLARETFIPGRDLVKTDAHAR